MLTATEFACHAEPPKLGEIVVFTDNRSDAASILEFAGLLAEENGAFGSRVWSCFRHIRIRSINHHLDRQGGFQPIGNCCGTSWRRSIFYEWERDSGHRICNEHRIERSHQ